MLDIYASQPANMEEDMTILERQKPSPSTGGLLFALEPDGYVTADGGNWAITAAGVAALAATSVEELAAVNRAHGLGPVVTYRQLRVLENPVWRGLLELLL